MEDFEKKLSIVSDMGEGSGSSACDSSSIVHLLRKFLSIQQRRAEAYSKLKRFLLSFRDSRFQILDFLFYFIFLVSENEDYWNRGFSEYLVSGGELAYQQLCSEITVEFNDCSKQVGILNLFIFSLLLLLIN